ncbi:MAG: Nramp family divalent metal transporter [Bacillota bacterium]
MTTADTSRSESPASFDPYSLTAAAIESPPPHLLQAIRQIGPGLILAGSIVGTGELIATTHLGAKVGFALLWLVIVSCFIKVFVQAELGRHAISSGQTTLAAFRLLPGIASHVGWWWLLMMLSSQLQLAAVIGGVGQALHLAMPTVARSIAPAHPELPWAIAAALATSFLLALGGYSVVEKGSTLLVAAFTLMTVLCVILLPAAGYPIAWSQVAEGLSFTIPSSDGAFAAAMAMFGITGVGATELVSYPYWCIEKGYARKTGPREDSPQWLARAQGWLRIMRLDAWFSMIIYTVATLAFYFLGAATLHSQNPAGLPRTVAAMLNTLSGMYAPVMGPRLAMGFIVVGVFAVLYSTLYAATAANARTLADFLHTNCCVTFPTATARQRWVRTLCVFFPILNLILFIAIKDPVKMVLVGGFIQAVTLPMIAVAAIYLRHRHTDRRLRPGRVWDAFLWLSLAGLCTAAGYGVWDAIGRLHY